MITHDITNIVPTLDESGRLVRLSFVAVASDGVGISESEAVDTPGAFPLPAAGYVQEELEDGSTRDTSQLAPYTSDEILTICRGVADERRVFVHLDSHVGARSTPVGQPSQIKPVEMSDLQKKTIWMAQIDNRVAVVTERFTRFQIAYEQREAAATKYKAAGYTGDPTEWITRYANNVGISYKAATDLILVQSVQLRGALLQLENLRMDKYKIQNAATIEDAQSEFNAIVAGVSVIERGLA